MTRKVANQFDALIRDWSKLVRKLRCESTYKHPCLENGLHLALEYVSEGGLVGGAQGGDELDEGAVPELQQQLQ